MRDTVEFSKEQIAAMRLERVRLVDLVKQSREIVEHSMELLRRVDTLLAARGEKV